MEMINNVKISIHIALLLIILLLLSGSVVISCEDNENNLEAEVNVIRTYKASVLGGAAKVVYTVENTGKMKISGWKAYFYVHMSYEPSLEANDAITYDLEPGEISQNQEASVKIPSHYYNPKITGASFRRITLY
ncbi:hypothetical protein ACFL3O_00080 [Candidatus Neomarinimicrobiota bacterium]